MDGISAYQENVVTTQGRGRLIVMLYDGAVKFCKQAIREMEARRFTEKGQFINKAIDIVNELNYCLDMEAGGEVAKNLRKLYCFMARQLTEANLKCDPARVRQVIALLDDLNAAWKQITS